LNKVIPLAAITSLLLYFIAELLATNIFNKPQLANILQMIAPAIIGLSVISIVGMSLQARHKLLAAITCQKIAHLFLCSGFILFYF
jgi:O-antigen/teichoic acid export membrane protein